MCLVDTALENKTTYCSKIFLSLVFVKLLLLFTLLKEVNVFRMNTFLTILTKSCIKLCIMINFRT